MPPKSKFTKEEIIAAAMKVVEREGIDKLTARSLSEELGSSARPIFTVFESMEELFSEVNSAAKKIYGEYVEEGLTKNLAFKGVGEAYIKFAVERPKLFQLLFMSERDEAEDDVLQGIEDHYDAIMKSITLNYGLSRPKAKKLYMHLWIYSHGIAVLLATKVCKFTVAQVSQMLTEVFKSILKDIKSED